MHRLFGKAKPKEEVPVVSLDDAANGLNDRIAVIDTKINALNAELKKYGDQMKKVPQGSSTYRSISSRAMDTLTRRKVDQ